MLYLSIRSFSFENSLIRCGSLLMNKPSSGDERTIKSSDFQCDLPGSNQEMSLFLMNFCIAL